MLSIRFNRWTDCRLRPRRAGGCPARSWRRRRTIPPTTRRSFRAKSDLKSLTTSGSYLAARHASVERDAASAAAFYRSALRTDPKNNELLDRAFISSLADGDIDEAVKLADRILTIDKSNRVARLVVGVRDLKQKKYATAQININQSIRGPITDLVATLLSGWASLWRRRRQGGGRQYRQADRSGMVSDLQGPACRHDPRTRRQGKGRRRALRARLQARRFHAARGRRLCALAVAQQGSRPRRPRSTRRSTRSCRGIRWCRKACARPRPARSCRRWSIRAQAGAAEALYGIGATLTRRGGEDLALVYLQLALYLAPNHPLALLSLADLYESVKKPQMAIKVYERVPANSPLKRNAQIQLATNLDAADRSDEAIKILKGVTAEDPKDIEAIMALGNIERGRKKFADCAADLFAGHRRAAGRQRQDQLGLPTTTAASARSAPSSGARPKPTCARRSSCSPSSRMC